MLDLPLGALFPVHFGNHFGLPFWRNGAQLAQLRATTSWEFSSNKSVDIDLLRSDMFWKIRDQKIGQVTQIWVKNEWLKHKWEGLLTCNFQSLYSHSVIKDTSRLQIKLKVEYDTDDTRKWQIKLKVKFLFQVSTRADRNQYRGSVGGENVIISEFFIQGYLIFFSFFCSCSWSYRSWYNIRVSHSVHTGYISVKAFAMFVRETCKTVQTFAIFSAQTKTKIVCNHFKTV